MARTSCLMEYGHYTLSLAKGLQIQPPLGPKYCGRCWKLVVVHGKAWKTGPRNSCQCRQAVASSSLSAFHNFVTSFADLPKILIIVKIDSIIWSFCLGHVCKIVYLIWARKLDQCFVKVTPSKDLASEILNKINISCYTEYKVFWPL